MNSREVLFNQLVELGMVTDSQADPSVYNRAKAEPILHLATLGIFDEKEAISKLSKHISLPIVLIKDHRTSEKIQDAQKYKSVSPADLWRHKILPLWQEEDALVVAFVNPFNQDARQFLEFSLCIGVKQCLASESEILEFLSKHHPPDTNKYDYLEEVSNEKYIEILDSSSQEESVNSEEISTPPIVRMVNMILADALKSRASDIHVEPLQSCVEVRLRIDGKMNHFLEIPKRLQSYALSRIKLLAGMDIAEKRKPQDGRFRARIGDDLIDFRVSCVPSVHGEALVLRLLNSNNKILSFKELGINGDLESRIIACLEKDARTLLVTGPTGSGKTTTLYTCLIHLHDRTRNIITIENPVEYRLDGITQIGVNEATGVTFASSLRAILRQDPDVIMIGEIRDGETANIAIEAATTGHKVLSTVHTNDAPSAITRLTHLGINPYSISCAVSGIIAQRLVRRICRSCVTSADSTYLQRHSKVIEDYNLKNVNLSVGKGCDKCGGTGYRGRYGLYSFLEVDDQIIELLEKEASLSEIVTYAKGRGYQDLTAVALAALKAEVTTLEEIHPYLEFQEHQEAVEPRIAYPPIPQSKSSPANTSVLEKIKLLLVEDDEDIRFMLKSLLENEFYDVEACANGQEALTSIYHSLPSIILCDLKMPVMGGREFLKRVRANANTHELPVIILTGNNDEETEIDILDLGAKDFISKDSSSSVILARIRRVMSEKSSF